MRRICFISDWSIPCIIKPVVQSSVWQLWRIWLTSPFNVVKRRSYKISLWWLIILQFAEGPWYIWIGVLHNRSVCCRVWFRDLYFWCCTRYGWNPLEAAPWAQEEGFWYLLWPWTYTRGAVLWVCKEAQGDEENYERGLNFLGKARDCWNSNYSWMEERNINPLQRTGRWGSRRSTIGYCLCCEGEGTLDF